MSEMDLGPEPGPGEEPEDATPPYLIESARSGRSKCKVCRKAIEKDTLRLGIRVVGPYGVGHLWHHLKCAARRLFDKVEEAYAVEAWTFAAEEPEDIPPLDSLRSLAEKAEKQRAEKKRPPYAERAPSGRAKCKWSEETIPKGAWRVVLGREVRFGAQVRTMPINVLPAHVAEALRAEDSATKAEGFFEALEQNSRLPEEELAEVVAEIGPLE